MTQASQNIPEQLRAVRAALEPLAATDVAAIAHARISLSAIATTVPDDCADAQRLLRLATHVASRIGADAAQADDDARRLRAVRAAVSAATERLGDPADFGRELLVIQAGQNLMTSVGREPSEWMKGDIDAIVAVTTQPDAAAAPAPVAAEEALGASEQDAPVSAAHMSLDDTAALLLMVEPHEREELERLSASLAALAVDGANLPLVRDLAFEAALSIHDVLDAGREAAERATALEQVSGYVERAVRLRDDAENEAMRTESTTLVAGADVESATPVKGRKRAPKPKAEKAPKVEGEAQVAKPRARRTTKKAAVAEQPIDVIATQAPLAPVVAAPVIAAPVIAAAPAQPAVRVEVPAAPFVAAADEEFPPLPEGDRELIADFVVECRDYLESAEAALLALEINPEDAEAINTVFRAFHTVKGTSGFLGLDVITSFAHEAESLFTRVRDRELPFAGGIPDLALRGVDVVKGLITAVEHGLKGEPMYRPDEYAEVLADLAHVAASDAATVAKFGRAANAAPAAKPVVAASASAAPALVVAQKQGWNGEERRDASQDSSIRVRTDRLDRLIDMVAELVIAQTMIAQDTSVPQVGHHGLARKVSHAGKIVRELHDLSLSMRMVPLKPTFQKMTRLVRDVALGVGKEVEFVTEGEETEIDRNMVDALGDPLVHMVRNAVDHGIETPEQRAAAGKPRHGTIRLSATHAGGNVLVELRDDGRGLDRDRIVAKAIQKGLIESADKMSESEIFNLIFAPGFSTAEQVTGLSGRGVGMDVVRRNIESLRGRIDISSVKGEGTVFSVRLPLTLAVTDGMLVQVGAERYVIPTTSIFMSFRPEPSALSTVVGRGEMVRLRDEVLPLFRLHRLFSVRGAVENPCEALVVVVAIGEQRVALLVDALLGQQQVVAKSLGEGIGKVQGVSGGAILGDGRVGLILDIPEMLVLLRRGDDAEHVRAVA